MLQRNKNPSQGTIEKLAISSRIVKVNEMNEVGQRFSSRTKERRTIKIALRVQFR